MAEYIEKAAAIKLLKGECVAKYPASYSWGLSAAANEISKFPSAEVVEVGNLTPCDACCYNPPSSGDGKPCSMCPASAKTDSERREL